MAEKKIMVVEPEEIKKNLVATDAALFAYEFALKHAGMPMDEGQLADFISQRNAKGGWIDLWEFKAWCEKTAASIKEAVKHTFNVGTAEELPSFAKWNKQSYTYEFAEGAGAAVANALVAKRLVTKDQLLACLTVSNISKASGLTTEKLVEMFPDTIIEKPKERTLTIK